MFAVGEANWPIFFFVCEREESELTRKLQNVGRIRLSVHHGLCLVTFIMRTEKRKFDTTNFSQERLEKLSGFLFRRKTDRTQQYFF
jgi:hypothetical protein